jgi:hypothetical protein
MEIEIAEEARLCVLRGKKLLTAKCAKDSRSA